MEPGSTNDETDPLVHAPHHSFATESINHDSSSSLGSNQERPLMTDFPSYKLPLMSEYPSYQYVPSEDRRVDGGMVLMLFISFISSLSFSVALPCLWDFVVFLEKDLDALGWAIALHSAGSLAATPFFVAWSKRRSLREVLVGSMLIMAVGGMLHGLARHISMLLVGRFVIGVGSANYVITTAYLSQVSRRTNDRALVYNGIVAIIGFVVGPSITVAFFPVHYLYYRSFEINYYTAPGYVITALALCTSVFTCFAPLHLLKKKVRRDRPESYNPSNPITFNNSAAYGIGGSLLNYGMPNSSYYYTEIGSLDEVPTMLKEFWNNRHKLPLTQLSLCFVVYFTITLAFTVWETVGPPLTSKELKWNVVHNGLLFAGMGISAGLTLIPNFWLTKLVAARLILPIATILMVAGAAILCVLDHWSVAIFLPSIALIAVGYAGSVSMVIHVYGRVLELSTEVATPPAAVGALTTCGSIARVLGPICVAYIMLGTHSDPRWLMVFATSLPAFVVLCVVFAYKILPP